LAKAGAVEELFDLFDGFLKNKGYHAMGGQIIDATIVSAPKQHNSREENKTIKDGKTPEDRMTRAGRRSMNARISVTRTISQAQIGAPLRGERRERAR
jgi:hypothetical protein